MADHEKIKDNLVIYNIPEWKTNITQRRQKDDTKHVTQIITIDTRISIAKIIKVLRLGGINKDGNPSPLAVLMELDGHPKKSLILGSAKKLKQTVKWDSTFCTSHLI